MNKQFLFALFIIISALISCHKDETGEKWAEEEQKLAEYIAKNKLEATFDKGIYIEKLAPEFPSNIQPETGNYVLVDYICTFLFEEVIEQVSYKDWEVRGAQCLSSYREGGPELWPYERWVKMNIEQLRENECAHIYVPSRIMEIPDFKTRVFWIHLNQVIDTDLKAYQETLMGHYMKQYGDQVDTITIKDNGKDYYVIYHMNNEGSGNAIDINSVKTHTNESYFLQDNDIRNCFRSKEMTWNDSRFSKMFEKVKKGGKVTVVMPYKMMYKDDSYTDSNKQYIAPVGSVLLYEISIDN